MLGRLWPDAQPTAFIGRLTELAEIGARLHDPTCRLLTLIGPGGIGKTRLALEAASAQIVTYPDGAYMVPLQPLNTPALLIPTIAAALDFSLHGNGDPKVQLLDYLSEQSLLLVLDNFEHLLGGVEFVAAILTAAPRLKILVTSREPLNLQEEWLYRVEGLPFPPADSLQLVETYGAPQLFAQCARRFQPTFSLADEWAQVSRVCQLVAGMPLALELAASWLRRLPCAEIVYEIECGLDILQSAARNIEPRHQSIRAVLDYSWNLLSDSQRNVFMKLVIFHGGFQHEAATYVVGASLETLSALVDKSMLQVDSSGRYSLHELMRQYAAEKFADSPLEQIDVLRRHRDYYADFLEQHFKMILSRGDRAAAIADIDNLRAMWLGAAEHGEAVNLRKAVLGLFWVYQQQGWYEEGEQLFAQAIGALDAEGSDDERLVYGCIMLFQTVFASWGGEQSRTDGFMEQGLAAWDELAAQGEMVTPLVMSVNSRIGQKNLHEQNVRLGERTLAIALAHDSFHYKGLAASLNSAIYTNAGLTEAARPFLEMALGFFEQAGYPLGTGYCFGIWGRCAFAQGDYAEARRYFEQAAAHYRERNYLYSVPSHLRGLAKVCLKQGDYGAARRAWEDCLNLSRTLRQHGGVIIALVGLGIISCLQEDGNAGRAAYDEARLLSQKLPPADADIDLFGDLASMLREYEVALEYYHAALDQAHNSGNTSNIGNLTRKIDDTLRALGLLDESAPSDSSSRLQAGHAPAADKLTTRELEILHCLAAGLSNREIASQTFLALGTVKWYVSDIFSKLGVGSRTQAIVRARQLNLLS